MVLAGSNILIWARNLFHALELQNEQTQCPTYKPMKWIEVIHDFIRMKPFILTIGRKIYDVWEIPQWIGKGRRLGKYTFRLLNCVVTAKTLQCWVEFLPLTKHMLSFFELRELWCVMLERSLSTKSLSYHLKTALIPKWSVDFVFIILNLIFVEYVSSTHIHSNESFMQA